MEFGLVDIYTLKKRLFNKVHLGYLHDVENAISFRAANFCLQVRCESHFFSKNGV